MAKFAVYGTVTASAFIGEYEAANEEEAKELAWGDAHISVCHQCAGSIEDPEVTDLFAEPR